MFIFKKKKNVNYYYSLYTLVSDRLLLRIYKLLFYDILSLFTVLHWVVCTFRVFANEYTGCDWPRARKEIIK